MVGLQNKTVIHIKYSCSVCGQQYTTAAGALNHTVLKHGCRLPSRQQSVKRPYNEDYDYQLDVNKNWDHQHHGCSSCWFHSGDYEEFQKHVEDQHLGQQQGSSSMMARQRVTKPVIVKKVQIKERNQEEKEEITESGRYDLNLARSVNKQIGELHTMFKNLLKM